MKLNVSEMLEDKGFGKMSLCCYFDPLRDIGTSLTFGPAFNFTWNFH